MADIHVDHVSKRFGNVEALADISLHVQEGEFFCVLGPPGAGKTTLLRTIVGLERPDRGAILIAGRDVTGEHPGRRDVAIVFQNLALYPDKTVYDNLAFPLRQQVHKVRKTEIDRRVREAARVLRIEPLLTRRPARLSGGERQRVAIGRSLVRAPAIYLLDEPLSALDALLRLEMRSELKYLQRELQRTLVYVTHDQTEAMSMADRICVLDRGRVQQVAPPDEVYNRPANAFVAKTVGTPPMNLIPLTVSPNGGHVVLQSPSFALRGPTGEPLTGAVASRDVCLGVRAEDIRVGTEAAGSPLRALVVAVEPLGSEVIVDLELDGRIVKAMTTPGVSVRPDEQVSVAFDLSRVHLFDSSGSSVFCANGRAMLDVREPVSA